MGNKDRGSTTHGRGNGKKGRGAGNRGGRGDAGLGKKAKHKKMKGWKEGYELGETGFNRPQGLVEDTDVINLKQIDRNIEAFVEAGYAEEEGDGYVFHAGEAGYDKVLGAGRLTRDIDVEAPEFSGSAESKIEENGNEAVVEE
ncbi:MAG: uL15m family ribosomal protein [Candidatus Nanohaloarchaea archaeon]|nr:uL15m family ribosomal protein [Candidatus Nanohaloarchaea archaeon]